MAVETAVAMLLDSDAPIDQGDTETEGPLAWTVRFNLTRYVKLEWTYKTARIKIS